MPYNYSDRLKEINVFADFDESQGYETDQGAIGFDPKKEKYVLITASGCSCWDGEYFEEEFNSFQALEKALLHEDGQRHYNPSLECTKKMVEEAKGQLKAND